MLARPDDLASYEVIVRADGSLPVEAKGLCSDKNNFLAACSILYGCASKCDDPEKFLRSVVKEVERKLEITPLQEQIAEAVYQRMRVGGANESVSASVSEVARNHGKNPSQADAGGDPVRHGNAEADSVRPVVRS